MMVGRLLSFWEGNFSGSMFKLRGCNEGLPFEPKPAETYLAIPMAQCRLISPKDMVTLHP